MQREIGCFFVFWSAFSSVRTGNFGKPDKKQINLPNKGKKS